jgi:hypothetical protein
MIPTVGCETVRGWLDAFADRELPVTEQVVVESHLRCCRTWSARIEDLRFVGTLMRRRARRLAQRPDEFRGLAALREQVLAQVGAERSVARRWRDTMSEGLFFWPAVGACFAAVLCLCVALAVLHAASTERPESLAAMIDSLSNPGSDRNPMRLDGGFLVPRAVDASVALEDFGDDEAVVTLATVVSRDGTIATYEVLQSVSQSRRPAAKGREVNGLAEMLGAVKQSRFMPAQAPGGRVVAVNMVWLLARTTVRATGPGVDLAVPLTAPVVTRGPAKTARDGMGPAVSQMLPAAGVSPVDLATPA